MTLRAVPPPAPEPAYLDVQPRTTDAGNARAFLASKPDAYRYVVQWEAWLRWTGTHWQREGANIQLFADILRVVQAEYAIQVDVVATARRFVVEEARRTGSPGHQDVVRAQELLAQALALLKFLHGSQNTGKVKAAITQLEASMAVSHSTLDRDPWLLNCANGTVDLRTGDVEPHDPADLITMLLPIPMSLEARAPTWAKFLRSCRRTERS